MTTFIDDQSINSLRKIDGEFARSLCQQYDRKGALSLKQGYWVRKLINDANSPDPLFGEVDCDMTSIVTKMHDAMEHLKWPKIRLETEGCRKVVLSVAGQKSKNPGTINITDGGPYGSNTWYGRIKTDGTFQPSKYCTDEIVELLVHISDDPAGAAAAHGHKTGSCCFCTRELTDERSTDVGYGPVCADHYSLPWGDLS